MTNAIQLLREAGEKVRAVKDRVRRGAGATVSFDSGEAIAALSDAKVALRISEEAVNDLEKQTGHQLMPVEPTASCSVFPVGSRWKTHGGVEITVTWYGEVTPGCPRMCYKDDHGGSGHMGQNHIEKLTAIPEPTEDTPAVPPSDTVSDAQALTRVEALLEAESNRLLSAREDAGNAWSAATHEDIRQRLIDITRAKKLIPGLLKRVGGQA